MHINASRSYIQRWMNLKLLNRCNCEWSEMKMRNGKNVTKEKETETEWMLSLARASHRKTCWSSKEQKANKWSNLCTYIRTHTEQCDSGLHWVKNKTVSLARCVWKRKMYNEQNTLWHRLSERRGVLSSPHFFFVAVGARKSKSDAF